MTFPDHLAHDPERCATCSPQIREKRLRPLTEATTEYLVALARAIRQARQEAP